MKIVIISDWFSESMGYAENCLPKALGALGHEVHVLTSTAQVYYDTPLYQQVYQPFIGPPLVECGTKRLDGYVLHRLPQAKWRGWTTGRGLTRALRELKPDIVQTFALHSLSTYKAACMQPVLGFRFFTGSHVCASVFPLAGPPPQKGWNGWRRIRWFLTAVVPGRVVSLLAERCYPATVDCADIAVRYFGMQRKKVTVAPLGVDTALFCPANSADLREARQSMRTRFCFSRRDIVCIYTGRLSADKNPLCLAKAISALAADGEPYRGLFLGDGPQKAEIEKLPGCVVHPFVHFQELPEFYRAADIGVWPRQESTSMLDATACGLPLVISNRVKAVDRIEGNGLTYEENEATDLAKVLLRLKDAEKRAQLGTAGAAKIRGELSWLALAERRTRDYEDALHS